MHPLLSRGIVVTVAAVALWKLFRRGKPQAGEASLTAARAVVSELWIFPVKGLRGFQVASADVVSTGFRWDRQWVICRDDGATVPVKPTAYPKMAVDIRTRLTDQCLVLSRDGVDDVNVPLVASFDSETRQIACDQSGIACFALDEGDDVAKWLSDYFGFGVRLGRVGPAGRQPHTSPDHGAAAQANDVIAMQHISSFLCMTDESIAWLASAVPPGSCNGLNPANFRANIILKGVPFPEEDRWQTIAVGGVTMRRAMLCSRCPFTTIDDAGQFRPSGEPLRTLKRLRSRCHDHHAAGGPKPMFGLRVFHDNVGTISVGNDLKVVAYGCTPTFNA